MAKRGGKNDGKSGGKMVENMVVKNVVTIVVAKRRCVQTLIRYVAIVGRLFWVIFFFFDENWMRFFVS